LPAGKGKPLLFLRFDRSRRSALLVALFLLFLSAVIVSNVAAQDFPRAPYFARTNTFGFFAGYSNDSSHILVGLSGSRKLLNIGFSYSRQLHIGNLVNWQYDIEVIPVALESDPLAQIVVQQTAPDPQTFAYPVGPPVSCRPESESYTGVTADGSTYTGTETETCIGRRWTMGGAISPLGMAWNFLPRRQTQPYFEVHGGIMFSTRVIPIPGAASNNFTFDGAVGIERFLSPTHSLRIEYCVHHISNAGSATLNPGIDNGMFRIGFNFGR
jgi:hypothetical protein